MNCMSWLKEPPTSMFGCILLCLICFSLSLINFNLRIPLYLSLNVFLDILSYSSLMLTLLHALIVLEMQNFTIKSSKITILSYSA